MRTKLGCNCALVFFSAFSFSLQAQSSPGPTVRFKTSLGDIDVLLRPDSAPKTVTNFLNYVNKGAYNNTFFHRSVSGFIIQGGGYQWQSQTPNIVSIPEDPPVANEYRISNTRGTIAMAKLGTGPNTATNQWFFNLANNASNLNTQNGGFTVFGQITSAAGLAVMDRIAGVKVYNAGSPFDQLPLINYTNTNSPVTDKNLVMVTSIVILNTPGITDGGIVTAGSFGGYAYAAPGSFIEIYGSQLGPDAGRSWAGGDFVNGNAPTSLDTVSVTVGGVPAYVYYISANQVNVQVPATVVTGGTVPVVVTFGGVASPPVQLAIKARAPGLLAPPALKSGEKQYLAAFRADGSLVSSTAPAIPGETLVFYGTGFGTVDPASTAIAGRVVAAPANLSNPVTFTFGSSAGQVVYAGLAPGQVGLYQFNVTVPTDTPGGDVPVAVALGGEPLPQSVYLPIQLK